MKPKIVGGYPQPIAHVPADEMRIGGAAKKYKNHKIDRDKYNWLQFKAYFKNNLKVQRDFYRLYAIIITGLFLFGKLISL